MRFWGKKSRGYAVEVDVFEHPNIIPILRWHIEDEMGGPCRYEWELCSTGRGIHWDHNHISLTKPGDVVWLTATRLS